MKTTMQKRYAAVGGLLSALYLCVNRLLPSVPEILLGLLLGLALVCLVVGILPEERWRGLRKWKRRGE